jgi:hypothetical protein
MSANPEIQRSLFENSGGGPLLLEGIIPPISVDSIAVTGNPWCDPPGDSPRDDQVINIAAMKEMIRKSFEGKEAIINPGRRLISRKDIIFEEDLPAGSFVGAIPHSPSLKNILVFVNGMLLRESPHDPNYEFDAGGSESGISDRLKFSFPIKENDEASFASA